MGTEEAPEAPPLYRPGTLGRTASGLKRMASLCLSSSIKASISTARRMGNSTTIAVTTAYHENEPSVVSPERVNRDAFAMVFPSTPWLALCQNDVTRVIKPCAADCVEPDLLDFLDVFFVGLGILCENVIYFW
jgi:hypothetical protein